MTVVADPRASEALIAEAVRAAGAADVAVVAIGEAKEHAGESSSRLAPDIPAPQRRLVAALAETGTPLVVVVFAGRPLALGQIPEQAAALIYAWHGGIGGPEGVADLIFGDAEPAGRLAVTLPVHPGEVPLHHAAEPTGRPFPGRFQKFRTGWLDLDDAARRGGLSLRLRPDLRRCPLRQAEPVVRPREGRGRPRHPVGGGREPGPPPGGRDGAALPVGPGRPDHPAGADAQGFPARAARPRRGADRRSSR